MQGFNFQHPDKRDRRKAGPFGAEEPDPADSAERDNHRPLRTPPRTESEVALRELSEAERARSLDENDRIWRAALAEKAAAAQARKERAKAARRRRRVA